MSLCYTSVLFPYVSCPFFSIPICHYFHIYIFLKSLQCVSINLESLFHWFYGLFKPSARFSTKLPFPYNLHLDLSICYFVIPLPFSNAYSVRSILLQSRCYTTLSKSLDSLCVQCTTPPCISQKPKWVTSLLERVSAQTLTQAHWSCHTCLHNRFTPSSWEHNVNTQGETMP